MRGDEVDDSDTGLGGWAWYQLGRWSAESDGQFAELVQRLSGPRQVVLAEEDLDSLLTDRAQLISLLQAYNSVRELYDQALTHNDNWRAWAAKIAAERDSLKQQVAALTVENQALRQDRDTAADFYQEALEGRREQVAELEKLVKKLRRSEG